MNGREGFSVECDPRKVAFCSRMVELAFALSRHFEIRPVIVPSLLIHASLITSQTLGEGALEAMKEHGPQMLAKLAEQYLAALRMQTPHGTA